MIAAALGALLSHWRRQPGQFATLVLGLALATALWSAVQAINAEARASYARAAAQLGGDAGLVLKARSGRSRSPPMSRCAAPAGRSRRCWRGARASGRPACGSWASTG
ncbi:hypothetical protein ACFSZS_14155 [Seohaeicola zhoushanensis]